MGRASPVRSAGIGRDDRRCGPDYRLPLRHGPGHAGGNYGGILIRDGVALEKAGQITAVLFDKTGTLTVGKPTVVKVWENKAAALHVLPDQEKIGGAGSSVERLAASLAQHSTHPVSQAVA